MATLYHAHPNATRCVVPPTYKIACPGGLSMLGDAAREQWVTEAIAYAYDQLCNLTTEAFSHGGDRNARIALTEAYVALTGRTLWADHPESCEL